MRINVNEKFQDINPTNTLFSTPFEFDRKRISLPPLQFKDANKQKRMWLKAVIQECSVKGNEIIVLEALAYLTDPVYGVGYPSIGAIQEKCLEMTSFIHRRTVENCLKRLEQKGVIQRTQRGAMKTNEYILIGFEYKPEDYYHDSSSNLNPPPSPKEKRRGKKSFNKAKTLALADARCVSQSQGQDYDEKASNICPEKAQTIFETLRNAVRGIN